MGVDSRHPLYTASLEDWQLVRTCYRGERAVKEAGRVFLPATAGMVADGIEAGVGTKGWKSYDAYRRRARFPGLVRQSIETALGVMHNKPPTIELPLQLEPLRERSSLMNESLEMLLRRINEQQLIVGRVGLFLDVPSGTGIRLPYVALYFAEDIVNWDDGARQEEGVEEIQLVSLNESGFERTGDGFEWVFKTRYRVLVRGPITGEGVPPPEAPFMVGVFGEDNLSFSESALITPSIAGRTLNRIPFVFVNAKDIVSAPDDPPMLDLGNLSMTIYRGEADYRQALFMQGQDTLVVLGGDETREYRTGAGATITPPIGADAKFIGVSSEGLGEMRSALENDYARAQRRAGELVDETSRERESEGSLRVRVAGRTATLNRVALAGAFGLQTILRYAAEWVGADPEAVIVRPNLDFADDQLTGQDLVHFMSAKTLGAPMSLQTVHELMQNRGVTEKTWEEELVAIEEEKELELVPATSTSPDGPEDDDSEEGSEDADPAEEEEPAAGPAAQR